MNNQVLHVDFISLAPTITPEQRADLIDAAAALASIYGVAGLGVVEGDAFADFDLLFYYALRDFGALEPFGTDARYVHFLQRSVAPVLKSFTGADVQLEQSFGEEAGYAACIAIAAPEDTYDWEVRSTLQAWTETLSPDVGLTGLAVGERQRYRGLALAFSDTPLAPARPAAGRLGITLVAGPTRVLA